MNTRKAYKAIRLLKRAGKAAEDAGLDDVAKSLVFLRVKIRRDIEVHELLHRPVGPYGYGGYYSPDRIVDLNDIPQPSPGPAPGARLSYPKPPPFRPDDRLIGYIEKGQS